MASHAGKSYENPGRVAENQRWEKTGGGQAPIHFVENRPEAAQLARIQEMMNPSLRPNRPQAIQEMAYNSPQARKLAQSQVIIDNSPNSPQVQQLKALQNRATVQMMQCTSYYLVGAFGKKNFAELKAQIGQAAITHFLSLDTTALSPLLDAFIPQGIINNAALQVAFLTPHAGDATELRLATKALRLANYDTVNAVPFYNFFGHYNNIGANELAEAERILTAVANDIPKANYIYKYTAISGRVLAVARQQLVANGNDPVAAEQAMVALVPYDYYASVKGNVDVMAAGKARAEIDQEKQAAAQEKLDFEAQYLAATGYAIDHALNRGQAQIIFNTRKAAFENLFPDVDLDSGNWGSKRDAMNAARVAKINAMGGRADAIEAQLPARTTQISVAAQQILNPVYAVNGPEAAANWCLIQAGQNLPLLRSCVEIMIAVNGNAALVTKLNPLSLAAKRALLGKLSSTQQGQLSAVGINDLVDLLAPLNGTAINGLVNLIHPALNSLAIDNLVLNLGPSNGTAINAFVQQYVPAISGADLADLVHRLRPLTLANIDVYINRLQAGLNLGQIYALTVAMTPGAGLIGADLLQLTATLMSNLPNPLNAAQVRVLVLGLEGVAGDRINTMVNQLVALGVNTGANIYGRIQNMRGSLQMGGAPSTDVTTLDGERILSGTQIAGRVEQVAGAGGNEAHLLRYPHSNIDPVGRAENLLWGDCDSTAQRHPAETAGDIVVRQQMALNAIINLGGVNRQIAQRVFAEQEGRQARAVGNGAAEDVISAAAGNGGHINRRHVLGTGGVISTLAHLQGRADGAVNVMGQLLYPPCPGIAGAFSSAADSQAGMRNALAALDWPNLRQQLIRGQTVTRIVGAVVNGYVARLGQAMNNAPGRVHIQFTGANVNGGFYIFESWPRP